MRPSFHCVTRTRRGAAHPLGSKRRPRLPPSIRLSLSPIGPMLGAIPNKRRKASAGIERESTCEAEDPSGPPSEVIMQIEDRRPQAEPALT